jgi:hypothetical protein
LEFWVDGRQTVSHSSSNDSSINKQLRVQIGSRAKSEIPISHLHKRYQGIEIPCWHTKSAEIRFVSRQTAEADVPLPLRIPTSESNADHHPTHGLLVRDFQLSSLCLTRAAELLERTALDRRPAKVVFFHPITFMFAFFNLTWRIPPETVFRA